MRSARVSLVVATAGALALGVALAGRPAKPAYLLNTHHHTDHAGGNETSRAAPTKERVRSDRQKLVTMNQRMTELVKKGVPKETVFSQLKLDDLGWDHR